MKSKGPAKDVDGYINNQPVAIRPKLIEMREIIKSVIPKAEEVISYQMPAFRMNKVLVYFAGCKNHIGFYPTGSGITRFETELSGFKYSKGAIQFPLDKSLPAALIRKIVTFRAKEDAALTGSKKGAKKK